MNPFDLRGPEFLVFFLVLILTVIVMLAVLRHLRESGETSAKLTDPYMIAYLRAGSRGAIQTALVSLIDRKIIEVKDTTLLASAASSKIALADPLERAIRESCSSEVEASDLQALVFLEVFDAYDRQLQQLGLIPDENLKSLRRRDFAIAVLTFAIIAGTKVIIALSRGRTNLIFLLILTVLGVIVAYKVVKFSRLTTRGEAFLADLRQLWNGLKERSLSIRPHSSTQELVFAAAVFGAYAIPEGAFPQKHKLFPAQSASADYDGGGDSACGSSSSGSDGGSSCGGGGCGSGCGGCGGGD